jgi:adenylate cyclase
MNSTTIIADSKTGNVIAASDPKASVHRAKGRTEVAQLDDFDDQDVHEAYRLQTQTKEDKFVFLSLRDGREVSASFARFPVSFGHYWAAIVLTPSDDFIGELNKANRQMVLIIIALSALELLLIYLLARQLSLPIESVSRDLKSVEMLSFEQHAHPRSIIREIAQLQSAAVLLSSSLQSFCSFAPVDLVRDLIKSGVALRLGVQARSLTIFFSDLEDFSTHAEASAPDELLDQMSLYFEQVTSAISAEHGTIDKFIGDGVMAFWGAPVKKADHALRGCSAALRAVRRLDRVNEAWRDNGRRTFRIRIGINSAEVLVGNIGSSERFSYTAIGDGVNVAARLEGINKIFGTTICISDSIFDAVRSEVLARPLRHVRVKGRTQEFMAYELLGILSSQDPELQATANCRRLSEMTWAASACFERGDLERAADLYRELLAQFPNDSVGTLMLAQCTERSASLDPVPLLPKASVSRIP